MSTCPSCKADVPAGKKFCRMCGTAMPSASDSGDASAADSRAARLEAARKRKEERRAALRAKLEARKASNTGAASSATTDSSSSGSPTAAKGASSSAASSDASTQKKEWKVGDLCDAQWQEDKQWYAAKVDTVYPNGKCDVVFVEYGNKQACEPTWMRPISKANARNALQALKAAKLAALKQKQAKAASPPPNKTPPSPSATPVPPPTDTKPTTVPGGASKGAPASKAAPTTPPKTATTSAPPKKATSRSTPPKRATKAPANKRSPATKSPVKRPLKLRKAPKKSPAKSPKKGPAKTPRSSTSPQKRSSAAATKGKPLRPQKRPVSVKAGGAKSLNRFSSLRGSTAAKKGTLRKKTVAVDVDSGMTMDSMSMGVRVWVHVTRPEDPWNPGEVCAMHEDEGEVTVRMEADGSEERLPPKRLYVRNPQMLDAVDDMTTLSYMHEPAIMYTLKLRYDMDQIYTYTGSTLIAVNPYKELSCYGKEIIDAYCDRQIGDLPPHAYAIAEDAYRQMMDFGQSQSVLVSGESGAGKTETTKFLLSYFAAMGSSEEQSKFAHAEPIARSRASTIGRVRSSTISKLDVPRGQQRRQAILKSEFGSSRVERQVLQSNPVLEAFGNAKTLRNDNSSRFGKFIQIQFNQRSGSISGARIVTYLLEKPRLTRQTVGERNFHIFYQLLAGATPAMRKALHLADPMSYWYLRQGDAPRIHGINDAAEFQATQEAMEVVGIETAIQVHIWAYLAGILHLGNLEFKAQKQPDEEAAIVNEDEARLAASLLGVDQSDIQRALLTRKVKVGMEMFTVKLKVSEAEYARDAFAMLLYGKLFDWIVSRINKSIKTDPNATAYIGVLDIYGFESFETNSYEQFCINYANEKLQQQFNQHIFKLEQQEYIKEDIDWSYIDFHDNQPILDLIEDKPYGILSILDEQCRFPKADHKSFANKMYELLGDSAHFEKPRFSNTSFTVTHYAGPVTYECDKFIDKNKDFVIPDHFTILEASTNTFVKSLFPTAPTTGRDAGSKSNFKFVSVGNQFKESLSLLMDLIRETTPHYVRCIKPNPQKKAGIFHKESCLHQLRCGGILECVRIASAGYPSRWAFREFYDRYRILAPSVVGQGRYRDAVGELCAGMELEEKVQYQVGRTKLFLRAGLVATFEKRLKDKLNAAATMIQKHFKGWWYRKRFLRLRSASIVAQQIWRWSLACMERDRLLKLDACIQVQCAVRMYLARCEYRRVHSTLVIQRFWRMSRVRRAYRTRVAAIVRIQRLIRGEAAQAREEEEARERAVCMIQSHIRAFVQRRQYTRSMHALVRIQAHARKKVARKAYLLWRVEQREAAASAAVAQAVESKMEIMSYRVTAEQRVRERLAQQLRLLEDDLEEESENNALLQKKLIKAEAANRLLQRRLDDEVATSARAQAEAATLRLDLQDVEAQLQSEQRIFGKKEARWRLNETHLKAELEQVQTAAAATLERVREEHRLLLDARECEISDLRLSLQEAQSQAAAAPTRRGRSETSVMLQSQLMTARQAMVERELSAKQEVTRTAEEKQDLMRQMQRKAEEEVRALEFWTETIDSLTAEVNQLKAQLERERQKVHDIRKSVVELKSGEIDKLKSALASTYGELDEDLAPSLEGLSDVDAANAHEVERLVRMTAQQTRKDAVYCLLDFAITMHDAYVSQLPLSGYTLWQFLKSWKCVEEQREYVFDHIVHTIHLTIPELITNNFGLAYMLSSVSLVLHLLDEKLKQVDVVVLGEKKYISIASLDQDVDLAELEAADAGLPCPIRFKRQLQRALATVYSIVLLNVYDALDPPLRRTVSYLVQRDYKSAMGSMGGVLGVLTEVVRICSTSMIHHALFKRIFHQLFYYVNCVLVNAMMLHKPLCCVQACQALKSYYAALRKWIDAQEGLELRGAMRYEFQPMLEAVAVIELPKKERLQLADVREAVCPHLHGAQLKNLLSNYQPLEYEPAVPIKVIAAVAAAAMDGAESQGPLLDKTTMYPLALSDLHGIRPDEMGHLQMPDQVAKLLAEFIATLPPGAYGELMTE